MSRPGPNTTRVNPFNSLYTRLAGWLVLLLFVIGVMYTVLNTYSARKFATQLNQDLNRTLAQNLVADKNLVQQGKLNQDALKKTFHQYMVVNPSIEIYLLDLDGKLLAYSADPAAVKRDHVSLAPIRAFLSGQDRYPLGDDPRSHDRRKPFSVTEVPTAQSPEGYLYVVLRGEQYDALESMAYRGFWARAGLWSMVASLVAGLLAGLAIFYWLTKRLRRLSRRMDAFSKGDFTQTMDASGPGRGSDEIGQIEQVFERMAERIQSQLVALTDKDRQRRQLVAQVSHDLRTPLASMLGYIESLTLKREQLDDRQQTEFLEIVYRQGRRLSSMIDNLFELSSLEAREIEPQLEPFMPLELLYDIRQKHAVRMQQNGLTLEIERDQSEVFALGDISLFERVLDNLIDNAIVHAAAASKIVLRLTHRQERICVAVVNRGPAIDESELEAVFEPFYRVDSRSADRRHAGLGLAISKRIMEQMNGSIAVRNSEGCVVFEVCLPSQPGVFEETL